MADRKVVTSLHFTDHFDVSQQELDGLIRQARQSDERDRALSIHQALKHYKISLFWAMFLSTSLIMEGFDLVTINSFYGQRQFQDRFGVVVHGHPDSKAITPAWQAGLSNSAFVGQLVGLIANAYAQDRFGCRPVMICFLVWMIVMIFIPFFAPSLPVLAFGEAMCGVSWGVFQTLSTTYACEIVPTILRPYVTAYVCMCWGAGILLSSGVVRAMVTVPGDLAWRLPFALQWVWPVPLLIGTYFSPESPWNAVRRGNVEQGRKSLTRLLPDHPDLENRVDCTLAYIQYTTHLESVATGNATFLECFRGTNLRRTEISCMVWAAQLLCGNALLGFSVILLETAGLSEVQAFNVNITLSSCYTIGGIICWLLFPRFGRSTIYMMGLTGMFLALVAMGGLAFVSGNGAKVAITVLFAISTLVNMTTIGPACYPIVAEVPSGRLRYKTVVIGRFVYLLTGIVTSVLTPRMISKLGWGWGVKSALFYAGTNLLCNIWCWCRLPETKDRTFGELDLLFENRVRARKFVNSNVDGGSTQFFKL